MWDKYTAKANEVTCGKYKELKNLKQVHLIGATWVFMFNQEAERKIPILCCAYINHTEMYPAGINSREKIFRNIMIVRILGQSMRQYTDIKEMSARGADAQWIYISRKTPKTLPRIVQLSTMMGAMVSFSGWRRMWPSSL